MMNPHRLPIFAELASPCTPAVTAGVAGCVTPIPIGPLGKSPHDTAARKLNRERVLEARIALLTERLRQALSENELLKASVRCGGVVGSRNALRLVGDGFGNTTVPSYCGYGGNLDICAGGTFDDELKLQLCVDEEPLGLDAGAPAVEAIRQRKRGGRGRGGKGKKPCSENAEEQEKLSS
jgi:hypothetical protein